MIDYNNPSSIVEAGRTAFLEGSSNLDCPISYRTDANAVCLWQRGWEKALRTSKDICNGENCEALRGVGHSQECARAHEEIYEKIIEGDV